MRTRKVFKKKHTCGLLSYKTWLYILTRKVFKKKTYLRFTWLYILIIIINTKLTSYTSH